MKNSCGTRWVDKQYCGHCHSAIEADSIFCSVCGNKISNNVSDTPQTISSTETLKEVPVAGFNGRILWISLSVIALIGIIIFFFIYFNKRLEKATIYPEQRHETYTEANISKYEGKIGTYPITLFIKTGDTKNGDEVGHYYYNKSPLSTFILKQTTFDAINASGTMRLVLKEYTQDGYHSGTFDGFFEMRGGSYHGTFTNSKGKKYKFELIKQVDY